MKGFSQAQSAWDNMEEPFDDEEDEPETYEEYKARHNLEPLPND